MMPPSLSRRQHRLLQLHRKGSPGHTRLETGDALGGIRWYFIGS